MTVPAIPSITRDDPDSIYEALEATAEVLRGWGLDGVEPFDLFAHGDRYLVEGEDQVDGDRLDIDFAPTYYTRDKSPSMASRLQDLTAHLKGIDTKVNLAVPGPIGATTPNTAKHTTLELTGTPPASPVNNILYKHPNAGGHFATPMTAADSDQALAGVLTAAQGGIGAGSLEGWHEIGAASEPAFQNSWANFSASYASAAFQKLPSGLVIVKGMVDSGASGTVIFTLPVGYRPALIHILNCMDASYGAAERGGRRVDIGANGEVKHYNAYTSWLSLGTIAFMAEQ